MRETRNRLCNAEKMESKQEWMRQRIVQFAETHDRKDVVKHFAAENVPRRTVYDILSRGTVKRKPGSGRPATIMTNQRKAGLIRRIGSGAKLSPKEVAKTYKCSRQHVQKTLQTLGFKSYHRQKAPAYTAEQITLVKKHCRWMHDHYQGKVFVVDDEKYFTLSGTQNDSYYARSAAEAPENVKFKQCVKYEKKLLVYLAASERGISEPFFAKTGLAVDSATYVHDCLERTLLPFLRQHHADNNYVFWPDKASSHYSNLAIEFMRTNAINFVEKAHNPTNLPQCRPIEDLWGYLVDLVYEGGWRANSLDQLRRRVRASIRKLDQESVRASFSSIRRKLRQVYEKGPYSVVH